MSLFFSLSAYDPTDKARPSATLAAGASDASACNQLQSRT